MIKRIHQMDIAELWQWLENHPRYMEAEGDIPDFWTALPSCLSIQYVKVSPKSLRICKQGWRNTIPRCWLEFGPLTRNELVGEYDECLGEDDMRLGDPVPTHDIRLDVGGDTFEDAFRRLCMKVLELDGDYERE